jgi:hypothetical protein
MQKKSASAFPNRRTLATLLVCGATCSILTGTLLAFFRSELPGTTGSQGTLTFAEYVAYQRAIEDVYWRHRIWPKERPDPKPSLDAVMSQAELEKKVEDYLRNSQELENQCQGSLTTGQLQAEMERMAQHTRQPQVLRELFEALGDDPVIIAECLARPALVERLRTKFYLRAQGVLGLGWARAHNTGLVMQWWARVPATHCPEYRRDREDALTTLGQLLAPSTRPRHDFAIRQSGLAAR